jgi:hypothetical protein
MSTLTPAGLAFGLERSQVKIAHALPTHAVFASRPKPFLDLFFADSPLNVDAAEREVRPPGAPTTPQAESAISALIICHCCVPQ